MSGDAIIGLFLLTIVAVGGCAVVSRLWRDFTAAPTPEPTELGIDEDEADPIYPFRRIGPVAADVVGKLDGGR